MRKWFSFCMVLFASLLLSSCWVTISHSPAQPVRPHVDVWQTAYRALVKKWEKMEGQELS